jgi:hypothetical protein
VKVEYRIVDGYGIVVTVEDQKDSMALREFADAVMSGAPLVLREVKYGGDAVYSLAVVATERAREFVAGYGPHGWGDRFTDEVTVGGVSLQLKHVLEVRPSDQAGGTAPPHGFVATVRLTSSTWGRDADGGHGGWSLPSGPTLVYHGEHASLGSGVTAVRKAYDRSMLLREGPKDES